MKWESNLYTKKEFVAVQEGPGTFQIKKATEKVSKSGNEMLQMEIQVWDKNGTSGTCHEFLIDIVSCYWKIKQFCDAVGLSFEQNQLAPHEVEGLSGDCELGYGEYQGKKYLSIKNFGIKGAPKSEPKDTKQSIDNNTALYSTPAEPNDDLPF